MNILIAPDSLKGSLTAQQAASHIQRALAHSIPNAEVEVLPISDGGEGALEIWSELGLGRAVQVTASDPLGRPISASYFKFNDGSAWVELSQASGLVLLNEEERNPMETTTAGTGELMAHAISNGAKKVVVGLGGSATNDGGAGILQGLGFTFYDKQGIRVHANGGSISRISKIVAPQNWDNSIGFEVACDVNNPLYGPNGASRIYGPQKGATPTMVESLDQNLRHWADLLYETFGRRVDGVPGSGAAGGSAAGLLGALGAELKPGFSIFAEALGLAEKLEAADVVITAEGMLDTQSLSGKATLKLCQQAKLHGCKTLVFAGKVAGDSRRFQEAGVDRAVAIKPEGWTVERSMKEAGDLLEQAVQNECSSWK